MKKVSMKKLSIAILAATGILVTGMGIAEAATTTVTAKPVISVTVTVPKGTAGAEAGVTSVYKGMPWLPCTSDNTKFKTGSAVASIKDQLQFDLAVTNTATKYDTYVFFVDYSASGLRTTPATAELAKDHFYALTSSTPDGLPIQELTAFNDGGDTAGGLQLSTLKPSNYRYLDGAKADLVYKNTLFGGPIALDQASLPQGLWGVLAVMVDPTVVVPSTAGDTAKLQNPENWVAWSFQPFILGTPFRTAVGTSGTGQCS